MRLINTLKSIEENKMCCNVEIIDTRYFIPPRSRSGATLTTIRDKAYLIGGVSNHLHEEIFLFDFATYTWKMLNHLNEHNLYKSRFAHSAACYQNSVFVYGGEENWNGVRCSDLVLSRRKHHASCSVGSTLLIHGGLDANGYSIDDFVAFSLTNESVKEIKCFPFGLGKLSGHTFVSISNDLKVQFPIFEEYDENADINKKLKITSNEGIYSFGGVKSTGECCNDMMFFQLETTIPNWYKLSTTGKAPQPRYLHTMNYCIDLSCLVVFGGRSEHLEKNQKQFYFNDIWLFQIQSYQWCQVEYKNIVPEVRHCHVSSLYGTKLMIFGGIGVKGLCNPQTYLIELNQD